ncbi:ParB/RepB/Spo0J family partition protein [Chlorobium sp. BLA1]|uniref:ParB/RepB/Spo0J family partition protein n=1 Tax=Candidatus Chlorobium masyuteum TaxID=2716876 RepID=UPI00141D8428|nr:ParB/RepB/Spo0J family partition protein [Candidatus Chlorobium masyuteum]NHQ59989.1 ParB/RepB/Spo0J family partition protein [Candidatus Chlorobium masyuteum]NTU44836.1 ParB/RepB/Spo0J family partition protein [Chlorobiaceae bacterium]
MSKNALGRGLKALIPDEGFDSGSREEQEELARDGSIGSLPIEKIRANPFQPRKEFDETALEELKNSIIENGVIQPVTVCRDGEGYQLISGERRLRAVTLAGFKFIPAYVIEAHDDSSKLELALIENIQREDLNAIEVALALKSLTTKCRLTQDEIAQKVGKNRSTVSNFLRLLKLPLQIQDSIRNREISSGHARALINLPGEQQQLKVWKQVLSHELSVRQTETLVNRMFKEQSKPAQANSPDRSLHITQLESLLRDKLATKVRIVEKKGGKGEIHIQYFSNDDLDRVLEILNHE